MPSHTSISSVAAVALALVMSTPARALTCTPGPYIIFFEAGSAHVDRDGLDILDNAVHQAGSCGRVRALIAGYTDTHENPRAARERIEVVRAYFLAHGFSRRDIIVKAYGTAHQPVPTGRGVSERQNRRVEIAYGPAEPVAR